MAEFPNRDRKGAALRNLQKIATLSVAIFIWRDTNPIFVNAPCTTDFSCNSGDIYKCQHIQFARDGAGIEFYKNFLSLIFKRLTCQLKQDSETV